MGPWWKQRSVTAGVLLATALAGTALAQRQLLGDPRQFSDIPTEGFDYRRGVPVSEDDIWPVPSFSRYDAAVEYAARRGWFKGYPDGSFRPSEKLTGGQLVEVIDRAFPDGMTRAQMAAFLRYGEWGADLTPGRWETNAIPKGSAWRVGYWDIAVRRAWTAPEGADFVRPSGRFPDIPSHYLVVELDVIWRASNPAPGFYLNTDLSFGLMDAEDCEVDPVLSDVTVGAQPGEQVIGNLCWQLPDNYYPGTLSDNYYPSTLFFENRPPEPTFYAGDLLNEYENPYGYGVLPPYWAWMSLK